ERQGPQPQAPIEKEQTPAAAPPAAEFVPEQAATPAQHERAGPREVRPGDAGLGADQQPRRAQGEQYVSRTGEPEVGGAAVQSASLEQRLDVQVAPHREALALALERQLHEVDPTAAEGAVGTKRA